MARTKIVFPPDEKDRTRATIGVRSSKEAVMSAMAVGRPPMVSTAEEVKLAPLMPLWRSTVLALSLIHI